MVFKFFTPGGLLFVCLALTPAIVRVPGSGADAAWSVFAWLPVDNGSIA